jgi:uncharacterized protein
VFELRVHQAIREIPQTDWDALIGASEAPFLSWAWLNALECTGCVRPEVGWLPHHLTLWEDDELAGAAPAYLKGNSEGEFVFDQGWARSAQNAGIPYYPKLLIGIPFTPATAPRLLVAPGKDPKRLALALSEGIRRIVERLEISSAHVLFLPEEQAGQFVAAGLAERYGVQFHWKNPGYHCFDDFLGRFSAKRRHQIKRERRELAGQGITVTTARGADITPEVVDIMYGFYESTSDKFYWGRKYLNRAFFEEAASCLRGQVEIVLAREGSKVIGGALNLAGPSVLYGRYWGASEDRPFLHFNVCYYHSIDECIRRGMQVFEPGAGGEHKLVRGFEPTITRSVHHLADPRLDMAVRDFLLREQAAIRRNLDEEGTPFR